MRLVILTDILYAFPQFLQEGTGLLKSSHYHVCTQDTSYLGPRIDKKYHVKTGAAREIFEKIWQHRVEKL